MDTRALDREIIERAMTEHAAVPYAYGDVRTIPIFDHERDHYLLMDIGRDGLHRVHGCLVHMALVGDEIHVERDGTERGLSRKLVEAGIAPQRIVLTFHPNGPLRYSDAIAA